LSASSEDGSDSSSESKVDDTSESEETKNCSEIKAISLPFNLPVAENFYNITPFY
jgi:hypothetical protein